MAYQWREIRKKLSPEREERIKEHMKIELEKMVLCEWHETRLPDMNESGEDMPI